MSDIDYASNYIRNLNRYKARRGGTVNAEDYKTITSTFEKQIRDNCNCPTKQLRNGKRYKLCNCKDN